MLVFIFTGKLFDPSTCNSLLIASWLYVAACIYTLKSMLLIINMAMRDYKFSTLTLLQYLLSYLVEVVWLIYGSVYLWNYQ